MILIKNNHFLIKIIDILIYNRMYLKEEVKNHNFLRKKNKKLDHYLYQMIIKSKDIIVLIDKLLKIL